MFLAIRRQNSTLMTSPAADTSLMAGDILICMGTAEQLRDLNQALIPFQA
jgi:voltage-gated potassium channel